MKVVIDRDAGRAPLRHHDVPTINIRMHLRADIPRVKFRAVDSSERSALLYRRLEIIGTRFASFMRPQMQEEARPQRRYLRLTFTRRSGTATFTIKEKKIIYIVLPLILIA